jgi:hypothetical protein
MIPIGFPSLESVSPYGIAVRGTYMLLISPIAEGSQHIWTRLRLLKSKRLSRSEARDGQFGESKADQDESFILDG